MPPKKLSLSIYCFFLVLLILGILVYPLGEAKAQASATFTIRAAAGLDGKCRENAWMPVRVQLENKGPDADGYVSVQLNATLNTATYTYPVIMPTNSKKEVTIYVFYNSYSPDMQVSYVAGKELASVKLAPNCTGADELVFGVISSSPSAFNLLANFSPGRVTDLAQLEMADIPERVQGLDALDLLIVSDADSGALSSLQHQAIAAWIAAGGRLIVSGGSSWQKTAAGFGPQGDRPGLLPFSPNGTLTAAQLPVLQNFAAAQSDPSDQGGQVVLAAGEIDPGASLLLAQDGIPLAVENRFGQGDVLYLTFDPSQAPFRNWEGLPGFFSRLLATPLDQPVWSGGIKDWNNALEAAKFLSDIAFPAIPLVCGFLLLYILALGPANYLFLRLVKRRELAWVTIPVLVIFFSVAAILFGSFSRGKKPILNQVVIVQSWEGAAQARVSGLVGIYSPRRTRYQLEVGPGFLVNTIQNSMLGGSPQYTVQESPEKVVIQDIRLDVSGLEALAVDGAIPAPQFDSDLILTYSAQNLRLQGTISNHSQETLEDAKLFVPGDAVSLGSFKPGESRPIDVRLNYAETAGKMPFTSLPFATSGSYGYSYQLQTTTIDPMVGSSNYYSDKAYYQRYTFLQALTNGYNSNHGRSGGVYLTGWSDHAPLDASLAGTSVNRDDLALFVIRFAPARQYQGEAVSLLPGAFVWQVVDNPFGGESSPYNNFLYGSQNFTLRFSLSEPIAFQSVQSLMLNLQGPPGSSSAKDLRISLWNFEAGDWQQLPDLRWGTTPVEDPQHYVDPVGTIYMSLEANTISNVQIDRVDFTLIVRR